MYKAIICDDDEIIADGLSQVIPWETLDIELCGCRYNGADGKKLLEEVRPDILISDIRMPFLDGLKLTRAAKELNPNTKVIIISGYDDFAYAQEAIRVGAIDYLLKPVDIDVLKELLKRAVRECRENEFFSAAAASSQREHNRSRLNVLIYEGKQAAKKRFGEEALKEFEKMSGVVLIAHIDCYNHLTTAYTEEELCLIKHDLFHCIEKFAPGFVIMEQREDTITGHIVAENISRIQQVENECFSRIRTAFHTIYPSITVTFVCGVIKNNAQDLNESYHEAQLALGEVFSSAPGSNIFFDKLRISQEPSLDVYDALPDPSEFISLINQGNPQSLFDKLDELENALMRSGCNAQLYLRLFTGSLLSELRQDLQRYGIDEKEANLDFLKAFTTIAEAKSFTSAMACYRKLFDDVLNVLDKNSHKSSMKAVAAALQYIDAHYMDRSLSMNTVAKQVHVSPSYFSVIFSQETGVSFTDYLIALRIRKSQELMRNTDLKIYEISLRIGYDTSAYFSTVFKRETGMSPSEYKRSSQEECKKTDPS